MPRLLEVATCVAERYPSLRIFCETNARVTRLPFPFSQRSHVGNLRQTIQGKGEKIRGWKPQVSTLLCARRVGALPAEVQRKPPRPLGANTPAAVRVPRSATAEKTACAVRIPRLPYTTKTKKAPLTRCLFPSVDMSAAQQQQLPQLPQPPQVLSPQVPQEPQPPLP